MGLQVAIWGVGYSLSLRILQKDNLMYRNLLDSVALSCHYASHEQATSLILQSIILLKRSQTKSTEIHYREKVHWKLVKDLHHLTSEHNQPRCGTSDKVPIKSCLSADIKENLLYDYEYIQQKPRHKTEARFQEKLNYSSFEMTVDADKVITNNLTLNVKNSQQSVIFNNNHEICNVARELNTAYAQTHETDLVSQISENLKWQNIENSMIGKPLVTNSVVTVSSNIKGTDSLSCNDSLSEAEDNSEPFSLQSEGLVWSEEDKDVHSEEKSKAGKFALVYAETFTVIPESPLYFQQSNNEHCKVNSYGLTHNETHITAESNLSEILSPVDEVLSYGSAELPSSLKEGGPGVGINSLAPPSSAFEIITWTSEEDLPAPPDFLKDRSIHSENIPPLPVDLSCKKDTKKPSETSVNNDANKGDFCQMLHSAEEDQEDECSEYFSSFPVDDSKDSKDLLSFFNIGDRVLVRNSSPGVLKYKGYTAFADGFWAGVALDTAKGNHNGTFRGVKYFTCQKSCGVLVRAEDISHMQGEQCNDADKRMDKDIFSDEDTPNNQDGKNGNGSCRKGQRRQSGRQCSHGHGFLAPTQTFQQEPCKNDEATDNALPMFLLSSERTPLNIDYTSHLEDSKVLIERLTDEIFVDALKNIQGNTTHDGKSKEINFRKKEIGNVINKPGLLDKWQQVYPVTPPQIRVKPHEHSIVYNLVDNTVETLCGQANRSALDACETPSYLVDNESRKTYRRVLFQLASDILSKICAHLLEVSGTFQKTMDKPVILLVQTRQIPENLLKDAVKRETQKVLNLGKNDQEMTEMLQTLCKYWYTKRDKVDYILIQELYDEEKEWVDCSNDQITVKMQLANDIFSYLLDDTISVLNQIYVADNK